jgi:hypothetical protein
MTLQQGCELNITKAEYVTGLVLKLEFSDGFTHILDFEPFLTASDQPEIRKYLNVERFKGFSLSYGNLLWNDYDLCFSIEDLYSGNLMPAIIPESMVAEETPDYRVGE